jgi:hypothetical protein
MQRAAESLTDADADSLDPFDNEVDQLVDDAVAARIAIRRSRLDDAWISAQLHLDQLAESCSTDGVHRGEAEPPWWVIVRRATGTLMMTYGLGKNRAAALLSRASDRGGIRVEDLAELILRNAADR